MLSKLCAKISDTVILVRSKKQDDVLIIQWNWLVVAIQDICIFHEITMLLSMRLIGLLNVRSLVSLDTKSDFTLQRVWVVVTVLDPMLFHQLTKPGLQLAEDQEMLVWIQRSSRTSR